MSCKLSQQEEYYDLKILKRQNLRLDRLVDYVALRNEHRLRKYKIQSKQLKPFYTVTVELVREFKPEAIAHVKEIQAGLKEYGFLYNMIKVNDLSSHAVYIKYEDFALMEGNVLPEIESIAKQFYPKDTDNFDATCLYLLIFYALLVNRQENWVTIDYITSCNRDHQYAPYIDWIVNCS